MDGDKLPAHAKMDACMDLLALLVALRVVPARVGHEFNVYTYVVEDGGEVVSNPWGESAAWCLIYLLSDLGIRSGYQLALDGQDVDIEKYVSRVRVRIYAR